VARKVRLLSWLSLGWMTIEGAVASTAGVLACSIALVGFGLDSVIEDVASMIIIWRFSRERVFSTVPSGARRSSSRSSSSCSALM
jgi:hypothetical protein